MQNLFGLLTYFLSYKDITFQTFAWNIEMKTISSIIFLTALLFCSSANAACTQAGSAGIWHTYSNGVFIPIPEEIHFQYNICLAKVNSSGYILSGSTCRNVKNQVAALTGRILVASTCKVTGSFKVGTTTNIIKEAWMDRAKNTISGIATIANGSFTFQAVRQ
jgi:hypothetical protein